MATKLILVLLLGLYFSVGADAQFGNDLWQWKIGRLFYNYDVNQDQLQDTQDVNQLVSNFTQFGVAKQNEYLGLLTAMWTKLYSYNPLATRNSANLISGLKAQGLASMQTNVAAFVPVYFNVIDTNDDLLIQINEYTFYFGLQVGLTNSINQAAFQIFAAGQPINPTLFLNGWMDYFTTGNPNSQFNNLLGTPFQ